MTPKQNPLPQTKALRTLLPDPTDPWHTVRHGQHYVQAVRDLYDWNRDDDVELVSESLIRDLSHAWAVARVVFGDQATPEIAFEVHRGIKVGLDELREDQERLLEEGVPAQ